MKFKKKKKKKVDDTTTFTTTLMYTILYINFNRKKNKIENKKINISIIYIDIDK